MAKEYQVQTVLGFEAPARRRAGIEVPARKTGSECFVGPLSDEQLAEIKDDKYLVVTELKPKKSKVEAPAVEPEAKVEAPAADKVA